MQLLALCNSFVALSGPVFNKAQPGSAQAYWGMHDAIGILTTASAEGEDAPSQPVLASAALTQATDC